MRAPTKTLQLQAFMDMLAVSEIGEELLAVSDNGYNVLVGSTAKKPLLFTSYADHPNVYNPEFDSKAAGRYQIIYRYWPYYKRALGLPDFSPESQDRVALVMIRECGALMLVISGQVQEAIHACRSRWASLTGAGYKFPNGKPQPERELDFLVAAFQKAGGVLA